MNRKFFDIVKSTRVVPGPSMTPRGAVPGIVRQARRAISSIGGFSWKHGCVEPLLPCAAHSRSDRKADSDCAAGLALIRPRPAESRFEVVAVNGMPVWTVTIPDACQPPKALPTNPC